MVMDGSAKRTAVLGMLLAFALILGYVESLLPFTFGIPGVKLGLANLAVLLTLCLAGVKEAFLIDLLRIIVSGFLFGSLYSLLYSLAGGMLSFCAMCAAKRTKYLGTTGVSIAGGVFHNVGQLAMAAFVVETKGIFYYLPALLVSGVLTGFLIGLVTEQVLCRIRR